MAFPDQCGVSSQFMKFSNPFLTNSKFLAVGRPIHVPTIAHPTQQEINEYHQKYIDALLDLWNENKHLDPAIELGKGPLPIHIVA
jgi:hypothetical protein